MLFYKITSAKTSIYYKAVHYLMIMYLLFTQALVTFHGSYEYANMMVDTIAY